MKGPEGTGEAGSRVTSRDTTGLSWERTLRRVLGNAVEVEERGCLHHSPSLPQSSEPCGAFRREVELTVPGPGVWTEICSSHSRMGKSGCIRARRPPQCHRGDLPCVPRVRRGCERAVLCGVVCRTFSWAHRPAHWSSAHRHLHGHPARVPAELGLPRGAALTSVGVGRGSAQNKRVGRHLAMSQHSNLVLQKS